MWTTPVAYVPYSTDRQARAQSGMMACRWMSWHPLSLSAVSVFLHLCHAGEVLGHPVVAGWVLFSGRDDLLWARFGDRSGALVAWHCLCSCFDVRVR